MSNHSRLWEQFRKGCMVTGDHAIGQRCWAVAGILPDNDNGPATSAADEPRVNTMGGGLSPKKLANSAGSPPPLS